MTAAPKKKGGKPTSSTSHRGDELDDPAYLARLADDETDGDYSNGRGGKKSTSAGAGTGTSKKAAPVSSSGSSAGAGGKPVSGGGGVGKGKEKEKGKETKRSASMKIEEGEGEQKVVAEEEEEEEEEERPVVEKRAARARAGSSKKMVEEVEEEEEEEEPLEEVEEEEDDGVTRCVCDEDNDDLSSGLMIECDTCKCWQHGPCVGLWNEKDCPDRYFCELCRPTWHGPGGLLRKAYRKNAAPPAPTHRRSPSLSSTSQHPSAGGRNKPRESADAALVSAFLASEIVDRPSGPADRESPEPTPAATTGKAGKKDEPVAKKRSTMNSRDAAYDDAIALSILGPGSAAMRARLARTKGEGSAGSASGEEGEEGEDGSKQARRRSRSGESPGADKQDDSHGAKRRRASVDGEGEHGDEMDVDEPEETLEDARREYEENEARRQAEFINKTATVERPLEPSPPPSSNAPTRAKHPNQYTYRPKNGSTSRGGRASPVKRSSNKDSGLAKGDSAYNGGGGGSGSASGGGGGEGAAGPAFLGGAVETLIRGQRPRDWTPGESGGWGMPDHLKHLAHLLPSSAPTPLFVEAPTHYSMSVQGVEQYYEVPTRVRFPNKRMTMPEMRKRARHVGEYLGKSRGEMEERWGRRERLALAEAGAAGGAGREREREVPVEESETGKAMEALRRELEAFQQKFWPEE